MTYQSWSEEVPKEIKEDTLWRMEVFRLSLFAGDLAWPDVTKLMKDRRTLSLSDQLFRAAGAVSSDIAEGYSRKSGKDQARYYEYALGSARETRNWCYKGRHVLGADVTRHRIELWTRIIKLLLTIVPAERGYKMHEDSIEYSVSNEKMENLLRDVPLAEAANT
jgi:four helix bundle protein